MIEDQNTWKPALGDQTEFESLYSGHLIVDTSTPSDGVRYREASLYAKDQERSPFI